MQQIEQEVETLNQEIAPLRAQFEEARGKWAEVHSAILAASDHEAASAEKLNNLEAALNSKTKELAATGVKYAQLEEKCKKTIELNRLFSSSVCDLAVSLRSVRSGRKNLSAELTNLKKNSSSEWLSLIKKIYAMYIMKRKTLEETKAGVTNLDAEITKARELESIAKWGLPAKPDAIDSSGFDFEFSGTEEEPEDDDVEGQNDEG